MQQQIDRWRLRSREVVPGRLLPTASRVVKTMIDVARA